MLQADYITFLFKDDLDEKFEYNSKGNLDVIQWIPSPKIDVDTIIYFTWKQGEIYLSLIFNPKNFIHIWQIWLYSQILINLILFAVVMFNFLRCNSVVTDEKMLFYCLLLFHILDSGSKYSNSGQHGDIRI